MAATSQANGRKRANDEKSSTAFDGRHSHERRIEQEHLSYRVRHAYSSASSTPKPRSTSPKARAPLTAENLRTFETSSAPASPASRLDPRAYMRKKSSPRKQDKKRAKEDPDSHPLNLPPDELRRLSAAMARDEKSRPSVDMDTAMSGADGTEEAEMSRQPQSPSKETPGSFPGSAPPTPNGVNGHVEESPIPPPHKDPPKPPVDAEACKASGNKFFRAKDWFKAIDEYTKAVDAVPSNPTYLSNRAAAYISANKFDAALTDSLQANQLDPANEKILYRLARIYTSLGRPKDALNIYAKIPGGVSAKDTAATKHALTCINSAETQITDPSGNANMAIWSLDQAKQSLGPGVPWPRRWQLLRARALLKNGSANSLGEVQGITTSLMRDDPTDAEAIVLAGRALYLKDDKPPAGKTDYERAEYHFRQALNLDPDLSEARECLKTLKKLERARAEANDAFKRNRYNEAISKYTDTLLIDPSNKLTNAKILGNRAIVRMKTKEFTQAIDDCNAALKLDPEYTKARKTRAKATGENGDWATALDDLKALAEEHPADADLARAIKHADLELRKSKRKDYYKILDVSKEATEQEINRAYKKKALRCHPDKFLGEEKVRKEEEFKELTEANETLSDSVKRQRYDSGVDLMEEGGGMGGGGFPGGFGGGGGVQIDPEMLFNMMGGAGGGGGGGGFRFASGGPGMRGGQGGFPF